jgi:predicted phosphodiesterase
MSKILIVPDVHLPFTDFKAIANIIKFSKKFKPDYIVQVGDLYDQYCFSRFRRSLDLVNPEEEIKAARKLAEHMWKALKESSPKADCFQLLGNHDSRMMKKILEKCPEFESLVADRIADLFSFKGVETKYDDRDYIEIENILFMHGFMCGLSKHLHQFNQSIVVGHSHQGGVFFEKHKDKILFELNAGHVGDTKSRPFAYLPTKISKSTKGFGIIEDGVPSFRPLE